MEQIPRTVLADSAELLRFTEEVLGRLGTRPADAHDMAVQIVDSELAGHESHGMRRLPEYVDRALAGHADPRAEVTVEVDTGALVRVDGNRGFGHLVLRDATRIAVERARVHGIAGVGVRRAEWAGRFVDFVDWAADHGVITLLFANASGSAQAVAPPGGLEPRLSTNPIAFGIPRAGGPNLVLDMATSAVAMGRVSEWRDRGEAIPEDWSSDGVLQFLGGAKGFGLALVAEALAGALSGAGTVSPAPAEDHQGVFLIAIDVSRLRDPDDFAAEIGRVVDYVKNVPLEPGASTVRVPGEGSSATAARRRAAGAPVQAFTWARLSELAERLDVPLPGETTV
ncbi:Ldh family oxidoreductase [Agromyces sp. SYSU T00266]|uniref:Ldh family oxidoreductase n=1 Tax=Agromyces zhanjiangensis TaxID=3158562 RepID=UPI0033942C98